MKFLSKGEIGSEVLNEIRGAAMVKIAVAFFHPDSDLMVALRAKKENLKLIVSEEFTLNDPRKLELLPKKSVLSIPLGPEGDKLHAKIVIVERKKDTKWVLVGSANLTGQGMKYNEEGCIALDSRNEEDKETISSVERWFERIKRAAHRPDLELAKTIFDSRKKYRLERRSAEKTKAEGYWFLKTTAGDTGREHWPLFIAQNVVMIGWPHIKVPNPAEIDDEELREALINAYPKKAGVDVNRAAGRARGSLRDFMGMEKGALVLICRGYRGNSTKPVRVYGFARVTGDFRVQKTRGWDWRFKRDAVIQIVDQYLPNEVFVKATGMESLGEAIHEANQQAIENVAEELGIAIEV